MTITEALTTVHATLQECTIPMRDADKASAALHLLAECISALRTPSFTSNKKDEST